MKPDQVVVDAERSMLRRAVARRLWLMGYDAADIAARILESVDFKMLLKGYEDPVAAVKRDCAQIEAELVAKYPNTSWELIQYMERCRTVYMQGMLLAESLDSGQGRAAALKVAMDANESLGKVQQLPVEGVGKLKTDPKKLEDDDNSLPGLSVVKPKRGEITEIDRDDIADRGTPTKPKRTRARV